MLCSRDCCSADTAFMLKGIGCNVNHIAAIELTDDCVYGASESDWHFNVVSGIALREAPAGGD